MPANSMSISTSLRTELAALDGGLLERGLGGRGGICSDRTHAAVSSFTGVGDSDSESQLRFPIFGHPKQAFGLHPAGSW